MKGEKNYGAECGGRAKQGEMPVQHENRSVIVWSRASTQGEYRIVP